MLEELHVEGYAIIDSLDVELAPGLNVLSGETGAGKSILIGAMSLILGARGDTDAIRTGEEEATVSGILTVDGSREAREWLDERSIVPEDDRIIIRRTLKSSGRGQLYVQSTPVTRSDVQQLTALLFDVHGQHEHQSLLRTETHRSLIDRYGGIEAEVKAFSKQFLELSEKRKRYEELVKSERDALREQDILQYAVREIEETDPAQGEEEKLKSEIALLSQHEKIFSLLNDFQDRLAESRGGALASIREAMSEIGEVASIVDDISPFVGRLETAFYEIEDIVDSVRHYKEGIEFSPQKLEQYEERLAEIRRLLKKYGDSIEEVLAYADECRDKLQQVENREEIKAGLKEEIAAGEQAVWKQAREISRMRSEAAKKLEEEIGGLLKDLGMPKSRFSIRINRREGASGKPVCTQYGIDEPEFLIAPNFGEPLKPLRSIVSGGEMSRVMLAIKSVLAETDSIDTLVFDEIDAGIGGQVALAVAEHLARLARHKQVLCITHLATIAVRASHHIKIDKSERRGRTVTLVSSITGEERVEEIARMLAGDAEGDTSLSHAREMLEKAGHPVS